MPDDLHTDPLAWSEQQADLLERLSRGERVNAAIDWPNVVEEVRDVGQCELRSVRSLLTRGLEHLLKLHSWPRRRDAGHWRGEVMRFLLEASVTCSPSMRNRIDLSDAYRRAWSAHLAERMDGAPAKILPPETCPYVLDDLLVAKDASPDIEGLLRRLSGNGAA